MFLRFISGNLDYDARVEAGIFTAAHDLLDESVLPDYYREALLQVVEWFDENLERPVRFSGSWRSREEYRAVCWFKPTAREHLEKAWEMCWILETNDVPVRLIKAARIGRVVYEDDHQVAAEPFA